MDVWFQALTWLAIAVTVACVLVGRRLHRLSLTLLILISVWVVVWSVGYGVANSDWGNERLSGWADCHNSCDVWDGVGAWLIFGPPIAVVVAIIATAVVATIDRARSARV